jgi:hypothetical protein
MSEPQYHERGYLDDFDGIRQMNDEFSQRSDLQDRLYAEPSGAPYQHEYASIAQSRTPTAQSSWQLPPYSYYEDGQTATEVPGEYDQYWSDGQSQDMSTYPSSTTSRAHRGRGGRPSFSSTQPSTAPSLGPAYNEGYQHVNVLFCVFRAYTGCDQQHEADDVYRWIEHHLFDHLRYEPPKKLFCWFCNTRQFRSHQDQDPCNNFQDLMNHVREHIVYDGKTYDDLRVDHFLLDHLESRNLVEKHIEKTIRKFKEGIPETSDDIHPLGSPPAEVQYRDDRAHGEWYDQAEEDRRARRESSKKGKSKQVSRRVHR